VRIFSEKRSKRRPSDDAPERVRFEEPVMDRELPMALFAAVLAAIVLVTIQFESSSISNKKEATLRSAYGAAQARPNPRLASAGVNFADTFDQLVR